MFPLLSINKNSSLFIYACDFAENAIQVVKVKLLFCLGKKKELFYLMKFFSSLF
jgi:hypothetical protein